MKVTQVVNGRFHHFHLARQLERYDLLEKIYTTYPGFKLKDESGIPAEKIKSFPWIQTPFLWAKRYGLNKHKILEQEWAWRSKLSLDKYAASKITAPTIVVGLSSSGLATGERAKSLGGKFICDRGSSHIQYQDRILREEYARWNLPFKGVDPRILEREEREYEVADVITVPSTFCLSSFQEKGVAVQKMARIPYGARLERFKKCADPASEHFTVLWVGAVSIRKAFLDALHAFQKLKHSSKRFIVVGAIEEVVKSLLQKEDLTAVTFISKIANTDLPKVYSAADVFVLSSIEEGLAMVQGEALACGCPVICSEHTGGADLFDDGEEGFVVPIRSPEIITERLQQLADDAALRKAMSHAALEKVKSLGGWNSYGDHWKDLIDRQLRCTP